MKHLMEFFTRIDGKPYASYGQLQGISFQRSDYDLRFEHIQASPGAYPASVCSVRMTQMNLGLDPSDVSNKNRAIAVKDYILRVFNDGVEQNTRPNRGSHGSGSYQPIDLPPQILERNIVQFDNEGVQFYFRISLPGSRDNRVLGKQACDMVMLELPRVIDFIKHSLTNQKKRLLKHCDSTEDMLLLQAKLKDHGLVAFIADGSILPRESGISEAPLKHGAVPFFAPEDLAVRVDLPHAGTLRGLGIRCGVTALIGGGFHGKSTLLDSLVKSVYPHVPGDGREGVATDPSAVCICAEDGRSVNGVDISGFIPNVPGGADTRRFVTVNASGSTSEAAAIIEAVLSESRLLLIDEDSSASNFLNRDRIMRRLIPEETIIPLFDRVRDLYENHGVSTLIVTGGSSGYIGAADHVIAMRDYLPVCMTTQARELKMPAPSRPRDPLVIRDERMLLPDNFNPSYRAERIGKTIPVRIKPLRRYEKILEYGESTLDLTKLAGLVDSDQILAVGHALLLARNRFGHAHMSPSKLSLTINDLMDDDGLDSLNKYTNTKLFLARPRLQDLSGAINRIRNIAIRF